MKITMPTAINILLYTTILLIISFIIIKIYQKNTCNYYPITHIDNEKALYKIVPKEHIHLNNTFNAIDLLPIDSKDNFIHTAQAKQVPAILKKYFSHQKNIVLVELDQTILEQSDIIVRFEQNKKGGEFFPHLYGSTLQIPAHAIKQIIPVYEKNNEWFIKK